jgi:two-component system, cell cycle sensor histidine kinase and response regulator CckA
MSDRRAIALALVLLLLFGGVGCAVVWQAERLRAVARRTAAEDLAAGAALALEQQIWRSLSATYALAALVRQDADVSNFSAIASEMLPLYGGIAALQLAPDGIVSAIHPLAGNEAALGHDLLHDPRRRDDALAAIASRQIDLAGPFELRQGGVGLAGRLPVHLPAAETGAPERFWGFTIAVLRLRDVIEAAQLQRLTAAGYEFSLTRDDPETGRPRWIAGAALPADARPVTLPVRVAGREWSLAMAPAGGWPASPWLAAQFAFAVLLAAALAAVALVVLRAPAVLGRQVAARTAELAAANARIAAEAERRAREEEQLRQAHKLDAIGQLAGGIAHDFNNLLTAILAHASLLEEEAPPRSATAESASAIVAAAQRAAELTRQLLGFAGRGKMRAAPFDAHVVVTEVTGLLRRTLDKRIRLVERLGATSSVVVGDPGQLQQALLNLAVNARDAMPDGGELAIETALVELDARRCERLPGATPGPHVAISVQDEGHGVPDELRDRIFEPFFTTKPPGRGTGMGLAMVYGIARNHGGVVELHGEQGRGARFTIYLPAARQPAPAQPAAHEAAPRGSGRVLVVDDDDAPRGAAVRTLHGAGYDVVAVSSGAEAVRWYGEHARRDDVVLLDLAMPEMDGAACYRALCRLDPAVRVVLTSGYGRDGRAQDLLDDGVLAFVAKPYAAAELTAAIAAAQAGADATAAAQAGADATAAAQPGPAPGGRG